MKIAWVTLAAGRDRALGETYQNEVSKASGRLTSTAASVRLRVLIPMEALGARGHQVELLEVDAASLDTCGARLSEFDVAVFKKTLQGGDIVVELFDRAVAAGVPTLFDMCDLRVDDRSDIGRRNLKLLRSADRVVASTPPLAEAMRSLGAADVTVITDPYEGPRGAAVWVPQRDRLKLLWFGHPSNLDTLQGLLSELVIVGREWPIQLTLLTGHKPELPGLCKEFNQRWRHLVATRYAEWSLEGLWNALAATDAVVIPSLAGAPDKSVKSPNRVVESLWAGRCVVANPLPAYVPFAEWGFIDESIRHGLERALADQDRITARISAAQAYIAETHSPERIGEQWERVIREATESRRRPQAANADVRGDAKEPAPPLRLNLGCGDKILPGYVNVDVAESRAGKKPDVICDLRELGSTFAEGSADEILSVHVIEHFWRWEALEVLKEWGRILRPGGKMILECPNLLSACEALLANPDAGAMPGKEGQRTMWVFYGDPNWQDPLMVHRWGYTPRSLAQLMAEAGLVNVRQEPAQFKLREPRDMRMVGEKLSREARVASFNGRGAQQNEQGEMTENRAGLEMTENRAGLEMTENRAGPEMTENRAGLDYLRWYYDTAVWKNLHYRGVPTLKNPMDMWNYQEIIVAHGLQWVVETGSRHGGSALFFADLLASLNAEGGVISIDVTGHDIVVRNHPRIRFVLGDSAAPEIVRQAADLLPAQRAPLFMILDSDHTKAHVLRELEAWVPLLRTGDYLVVEDTCINGHPVRPDFGPGPYEAVEAFVAAHPDELIHDEAREQKFGYTFAPKGFFIRA